MRVALKNGFCCWGEDTDLEMDLYCRCSKWAPLAGTQAVKASASIKTSLQLTWRAPRRNGFDRTVLGSSRRIIGSQTLHIWTHWTITSGLPWWKSTINSAETKTIDEMKVALKTVGEELPQEHINKVVANFTKHLTGCQWWSLRAPAVKWHTGKNP